MKRCDANHFKAAVLITLAILAVIGYLTLNVNPKYVEFAMRLRVPKLSVMLVKMCIRDSMYAEFAKIAREEGFNKIAAQMDMVAKIEKRHEERYLALLSNVKEDKVFKKEEDVMWKCQICGYTLVGKNAPGLCPLCGYAKSFFEVEKANY